MEQHKELHKLTKKLLDYTRSIDEKYENVRSDGKEPDFYSEVKPFADQVIDDCKTWEKGMKGWMAKESFRHLYPSQIEQTAGNLADVAVQCFFPKTSYKRFKSHIQSVRFILQNTEDEISKKVEEE
ncbi:YppE family protein [Bacillus massiliglaciei]|uniref:YppE family protein n=1 Tax=Bacillus massiliglaciei TaxID=1816693 RepID=UPI000DA63214|nr:YppE family protein [Bacillus massiliglaciei]